MNFFKYAYKLINFLSIPKEIVIIFNKRLSIIMILIFIILCVIITL